MSTDQLNAMCTQVEKWAQKISKNESVNAQDFLKEGLQLKDGVLGSLAGQQGDFLMAGVTQAILSDAKLFRDGILKLAYSGDVDPLDFYEFLRESLGKKSDLSSILPILRKDAAAKIAVNSCEMCTTCVSCVSCSACLLCIVTGVEATAAAVFSATTSTSASAAA